MRVVHARGLYLVLVCLAAALLLGAQSVSAEDLSLLRRVREDADFAEGSHNSGLGAWASNQWRLWPHDDCCRPKTLFAWRGKDRTCVNGTEDEPLQSDRPDFTEASTTVGLRRVQVEMGYTYIRDNNNGTLSSAHSFPETLYRIGMFAEWFEFRVAWNYGIHINHTDIISNIFTGGNDLYLGAKIALTEQDGWRPEMAIVPQMNVPTGHEALSDHEVTPGVNWLYGWDVTEFIAIGGSTQVNRALDDADVFFTEFAQSMTVNYTLTDKLGGFTEWFAFFPAGSVVALPEHYFDAGFTYRVNNNFQLDIRAGVGLNDAADDFFVGSGSVLRF